MLVQNCTILFKQGSDKYDDEQAITQVEAIGAEKEM